MTIGQFTDRGAALGAVRELLAPGGSARLLMVFGGTGQGKTRLLKQIADTCESGYRPQLVDLQQIVVSTGSFPGRDSADDFAVLLLREVGAALARQARWWQRPARLVQQARQIGAESQPHSVRVKMDTQIIASDGGKITSTQVRGPVVGDPVVDTVRRGRWIAQLATVGRRVRRRRLLLLVDTCEWMTAFDEPVAASSGRPMEISPWFLRQVLPQLLDATPHLKVILAGWDRLDVDTGQIPSVPAVELTGWTAVDTQKFLTGAGIDDPAIATLVHQSGDGLPLLAGLVADESDRWRTADGTVDTAALVTLIRQRPADCWVPDLILSRLTSTQREEITAAAVLREITQPAVEALLPEHDDQAGPDWFNRLTGRSLLQELPDIAAGGRRWRMHSQVRRWILDYLTDFDTISSTNQQQLPELHRRAAGYYADLQGRVPNDWSTEFFYHRFALGDATSAADWQARILTATRTGQTATVGTLAGAALAPEHHHTVRDRLPVVAATALACTAWLAYQHGDFVDAETQALDAASLYQQTGQPSGQVWARCLAGQAAWADWRWACALDHWQRALAMVRGRGNPAAELALLVALGEVTLGCGDLVAARSLLDTARVLHATHPTSAEDPPPDTLATPPLPCLASAVSTSRLAVWLTLQAAEVEIRADDLPAAARLLDAADQRDTHPAEQVSLLRLRAEYALADDHPPEADRLAEQASFSLSRAGNTPAQRIAVLLTQAAATDRMSTFGPPLAARPPTLPCKQPTRTLPLADLVESRRYRDIATEYAHTALDVATDITSREAQACALVALGHYPEALALFEQIGDRRGQARALLGLGKVADGTGDYASAGQHYRSALALFKQIGDRRGRANALLGLGETAHGTGDYASAGQHYRSALALFKQIGDRSGQGKTLRNLGNNARLQGEYATAEQHLGAALTFFEQIGDRSGQASTRTGMGEFALARDDSAGAEDHFGAALTLYRKMGSRPGRANASFGLGEVARRRGDPAGAEDHFGTAFTLYKKMGSRPGQAIAMQGIGDTTFSLGEYRSAKRHYNAALNLSKQTGSLLMQTNALQGLGDTYFSLGKYSSAEQHYNAALNLSNQTGNQHQKANSLLGLGEVELWRKHDERARNMLFQAAKIYDTLFLTAQAEETRRKFPVP